MTSAPCADEKCSQPPRTTVQFVLPTSTWAKPVSYNLISLQARACINTPHSQSVKNTDWVQSWHWYLKTRQQTFQYAVLVGEEKCILPRLPIKSILVYSGISAGTRSNYLALHLLSECANWEDAASRNSHRGNVKRSFSCNKSKVLGSSGERTKV